MIVNTPFVNVFFYEDTAMMHKGTVKWTDQQQNYGFIIPDDDNTQNIFIHISLFKKLGLEHPKNGQRVGFETPAAHNSILAVPPLLMFI